jgi:hypothetical protein
MENVVKDKILVALGLLPLISSPGAASAQGKPTPDKVDVPATIEQKDSLQALRDDPVSVLDFGLEMMWRDLSEVAKGEINYFGRLGASPARIDIANNLKEGKIWISVESWPGTEGPSGQQQAHFPLAKGAPSAQAWCTTLIAKLRAELATGLPDGFPHWLRYFVHNYRHSSLLEMSQPKPSNEAELTQVKYMLVKSIFLRAHTVDDERSATCVAPLVGGNISTETRPNDPITE